MKLSDVVSAAGLAWYAEVALILFLLAFIGVVVWVSRPSRRATYDDASRLPLDDGERRFPEE